MGLEDGLLIGVALVIALNRMFVGTRLLESRAAYVFVQAFNVGAAVALFFARLFPDFRLDYAVRGFLMLFVAWHMVQNFVMRAAIRRPTDEETSQLAAARKQIELDIAAEREEDRKREEAARASAQGEADAPSDPV
jgi:ABC-type uncharacterized transport system permease subunit